MQKTERAVKDLGLIAAYIEPIGVSLMTRTDVFYQTVVDLDIPLLIHPATNNGIRGAADERLSRFDLTSFLDMPRGQ